MVATVADILAGLDTSAIQSDADKARVNEIAGNMIKVKQDEAAQMERASKDAELVKMTEQQGQLNRQAANARAKQQLNVDEVMATVATQLHSEYLRAEQLDKTIQAKESVSFFDNPFEYVINQTTINDDIDAYNSAADSINRKTNYITAVNNLTQEAAQTNLATMETVSQASAEASARVAGMDLLKASNDAKLSAGTVDLNRVQQLAQINDRGLDALIKQRQIINNEASLAMQREEAAANRAERAIRLKAFQEEKADKQEERNFNEKIVALANRGAAVNGSRPFANLADFKLFRTIKGNAEIADKLLDLGYQSMEKDSTGKPIQLAETPADTAEFILKTKGRLAPTQKKVQELIVSTSLGVQQGTLSQVANGATINTKNPLEVKAQVNSLVRREVETMQKDVMVDRERNIYAPPSLNSITTQVPILKNSNLYIKLIKPQVDVLGDKPLNPQELVNQAATAILNKQLTYAEATQGLEKLFGSAVIVNNTLTNYGSMGLPEQSGLKTKIKSSDTFGYGSSKSRDLANPTDLRAAIISVITAKNAERSLGLGDSGSMQLFEQLGTMPSERK